MARMKGIFRRSGQTIVPAGDDGREALLAIPEGGQFVADIRMSRNPAQHRLFFALCQILSDNSEIYDNKEKAKRGLLFATGRVVTWMDHLGVLHLDPQSIAFDAMEQGEFNAFFQLAVAKICDWLGNAPKEVIDEVNKMVDPIKSATIPDKPEPPLDRTEEMIGRMPEPELEDDPETGEILSPAPPPEIIHEQAVARKIVEPATSSIGPIKWKALVDGLLACRTIEEAQQRAKGFWRWNGGFPPDQPADEAKAKAINTITKRYITGEITLIIAHQEMERALQL